MVGEGAGDAADRSGGGTNEDEGAPHEPPLDLAASTRPPPVARVDPYIGRTFDGRYVIHRKVGEGGMGVVYAGKHKVIDKRVAIKVLRGEMASDKDATHRFLMEARAASAAGSPHIVDVSDFGNLPDGADYFVMEYLDGQSLAKALDAERPMPAARILAIAQQIALGLAAAHDAGIVHRDLKPENVMLVTRGAQRDFVKILDFGIAKVGTHSRPITLEGAVFGTPHYMSPEQASGAPVDRRADVYALGVILYELATGKVPFDGENYMAVLSQHVHRAPPPPRGEPGVGDVSDALEAVILRCLRKAPDERYPTMTALAEDLAAVARGEAIAPTSALWAPNAPEGAPSTRDERRRPARASSGGNPVAAPDRGSLPAPGTARRAVLALSLAGAALALLWVLRPSPPPLASPSIAEPAPSSAADLASAAAMGAVTGASGASSAVPSQTKQVLVGVEPADARVARDGIDLGQAPVAIDLEPGASAILVVTRAGYKPQTLTVDASQPKRLVRLAPIAPPRPPPPGITNDLGDPWKR